MFIGCIFKYHYYCVYIECIIEEKSDCLNEFETDYHYSHKINASIYTESILVLFSHDQLAVKIGALLYHHLHTILYQHHKSFPHASLYTKGFTLIHICMLMKRFHPNSAASHPHHTLSVHPTLLSYQSCYTLPQDPWMKHKLSSILLILFKSHAHVVNTRFE